MKPITENHAVTPMGSFKNYVTPKDWEGEGVWLKVMSVTGG